MASGTIQGAKVGSYGVWIAWDSAPDVETNTSRFTLKTYVSHPKINISSRTGSTTIDGSTESYKTGARDAAANDAWLVDTRTETIQHNDDGTREISVPASFPFKLNSSSHGEIGTLKASGKCVLDNIPRASEVSSQTGRVTVNGDNKWTLTVAKHATAFRHKATLTIGSYSHTTAAFDTATEYAIPTAWMRAFPNSQTGTVTVAIQTYSDSSCTKPIGDPVYTSFTVAVPSNAAPVIEDGWASVAPYNIGTAAAAMTVYVQGYSRAQVTFDSSKAYAQHGASIASVKVQYDGAETAASPYLTKVLGKSGRQYVRCIVTDTRGMQRYKDLPIDVEAYSGVTLTDISIYRCDSTGAASELGTFLYFKARANYSSCGGQNAVTLTAAYKPASNSIWTNNTAIGNTEGSILGAGALSAATSYNARIFAKDTLGRTASFEVVISTAEAAFNLKDGGKGGAFGKYAEEDDLLDCDWRFRARGGIYGVTLYSAEETEHGVWIDGSKAYMRVLTGNVSAGTASAVGTIAGFKQLISAQGAVNGNALSAVSVGTGGSVVVTAPASGTAHVILIYTKE